MDGSGIVSALTASRTGDFSILFWSNLGILCISCLIVLART